MTGTVYYVIMASRVVKRTLQKLIMRIEHNIPSPFSITQKKWFFAVKKKILSRNCMLLFLRNVMKGWYVAYFKPRLHAWGHESWWEGSASTCPPLPTGAYIFGLPWPGKPLLIWEPWTLQPEALPFIPVLEFGPDPQGLSPSLFLCNLSRSMS